MRNIDFQNIELAKKLFGYHNTHLEKISSAFNITINSRGNAISLSGDAKQMKLFLTRIEYGSKAIVTGDITQIDLPTGKKSGLIEAKKILTRINGIEFVYFTKDDVVRHPLVSNIIYAYEKNKT